VPRVTGDSIGQILDGVWRFESVHPEWTEDEGGEEGWDSLVGWWAVGSPAGLVLVDPLVDNWPALDQLVEARGGCAGVIRTCHWHERSVAGAATRYDADVWAGSARLARVSPPHDHSVSDRAQLFEGITAFDVERDDEIALWVAPQRALVFGDAMIRRRTGELRVCPESWTQPPSGPARLRSLLRGLTELPVEHVLVSHGPLVLGDGERSLRAATS
jgi:glyoxylase-like metal-dependent hydrolase (beta-lactamase superfamily II)